MTVAPAKASSPMKEKGPKARSDWMGLSPIQMGGPKARVKLKCHQFGGLYRLGIVRPLKQLVENG